MYRLINKEGVKMTKNIRNESMCFACSPKNPIGLKLQFFMEGDTCKASFVGGPEHQGWAGLIHGGLIATLLDEVMAQWLWKNGITAMTAEMTTRFKKAVPVDQELTLEGYLLSDRGRLVELGGRIVLPGGEVAAEATSKFFRVDPENMAKGVLKVAKGRSSGTAKKEPEE